MPIDSPRSPVSSSDVINFPTKKKRSKAGTTVDSIALPEISSEISTKDSLEQWEALLQKSISRLKSSASESVFGKSAKRGSVYRWGVAVACGDGCPERLQVLSRLTCDEELSKKHQSFDFAVAAESFIDLIESPLPIDPLTAAEAVLWAAAMPRICRVLGSAVSWRVLTALRELHEAVAARDQPQSSEHLMLVGELGLTLAWRLPDVPSCARMQTIALSAITDWCENLDESIADAVVGAVNARLVLASLVRCESLMQRTAKRKFKKTHTLAADLLATWVAAMTLHTGSSAMSRATGRDVSDDLVDDGLLDRAIRYDIETLKPAMAAALGEGQTGGRLAWEVSLPESMWSDPDSKLAILLPEWDVRRGRTHLDYSGENVSLEIFSGRTKVIDGAWQAMIEVDGEEQQPNGQWSQTCEYSDDDVHYIEIEQPWTGGLLLQRQVMLVREDRCLLLADAIVPDPSTLDCGAVSIDRSADLNRIIRYWSRLPQAAGIVPDPEPETREIFLSDGRRRAMLMPISAGEWRVGPSAATLSSSEDHCLVLTGEGRGSLYCPLWIDFSQRRFKRKRTWRQLTVVHDLKICPKNDAVGFRVQVGSEQWMVYRTLGQPRTRSVLGKHLIADFFASRFDPTDGDHDALVTVDDSEAGEDD